MAGEHLRSCPGGLTDKQCKPKPHEILLQSQRDNVLEMEANGALFNVTTLEKETEIQWHPHPQVHLWDAEVRSKLSQRYAHLSSQPGVPLTSDPSLSGLQPFCKVFWQAVETVWNLFLRDNFPPLAHILPFSQHEIILTKNQNIEKGSKIVGEKDSHLFQECKTAQKL